MLKPALETVRLPDGQEVSISRTPLDWWEQPNASGYVSPFDIAPDLDNPRKRMNPVRQAEINESIKSYGVRQPLVLSPRHLAPWARVDPEHKRCYFVAVSGHRRRLGATLGNVAAVPIKVCVYADEKAYRMDMTLLNKGQDDLTPLDEGYEIVDLQKVGWKVEELCKAFGGIAAPQLYSRMNLTKLAPDLQELLDDELPREKRLQLTVGGFLGGVKQPTAEELEIEFNDVASTVKRSSITKLEEFDGCSETELVHILQRLLFAVIQARKLTSTRAIEFIRERTLKFQSTAHSGGKKSERHQPARRKDIIKGLVSSVTGSVAIDWKAPEWQRIFELSSREEVEEYMKGIQECADTFTGILKILSRIRDGKKASHPDVIKAMANRSVPA